MIYNQLLAEVARARSYFEKKPLPTIPITSQRQSVIGLRL
jgi:hypothetical protein